VYCRLPHADRPRTAAALSCASAGASTRADRPRHRRCHQPRARRDRARDPTRGDSGAHAARQHPLADRHGRENVIDELRGPGGHPPAAAVWAEAPSLAGERHEPTARTPPGSSGQGRPSRRRFARACSKRACITSSVRACVVVGSGAPSCDGSSGAMVTLRLVRASRWRARRKAR
jgi:hypothetical protein